MLRWTAWLWGFMLIAVPRNAHPQPVRVNGGFSIYSELYGQNGLALGRRPGQQLGAQGQLTLTIGNQLTLPFSFYLSTDDVGYQLPFNQFGFSPRWRWIQLHAGYFSTRLTELTLRDARLLGGGFELTPGPFRLAFVQGLTQRAVPADTLRGQPPLLRQTLTALQIGVGREDGWHFWITGLRAKDTPDLEAYTTYGLAPQDNLVVSAAVGLAPLPGRLQLKTEVAASVYTPDVWAGPLDFNQAFQQVQDLLGSLVALRVGSRVDVAVSSALILRPARAFQLQLQSRYVGPGFRSLGAIQLENDILDLLVAPRILTRVVQMTARFGVRRNNLAGSRLSTRQRGLAAINATILFSSAFSVAAEFTNFGVRLSRRIDTLTVSNISRQFGLTPTLRLQAGAWLHTITLSARYQQANERYVGLPQSRLTRNQDLMLSHSLTFPQRHTLTSSITWNRSSFDSLKTTVLNWNESLTLQWGRTRATFSVGLQRSQSQFTDTGLIGRFNLSVPAGPRGQLQLRLNLRSYRYGQVRLDSRGYTEGTAYLGYSYRF
ncbi:hypothetical protein [Rhodothermus profundi]|uniref:Uncharacterized protein n=1 Tax=Rhodothermus profundi TaxID=633813 RepID=A0A1M6XB96_9BACT|nr:hypothetical protein [Rhodothermus profundi]SHL03203.1 hypothetical protein SAMN04488087_2575 [Rhodothermus profundi]